MRANSPEVTRVGMRRGGEQQQRDKTHRAVLVAGAAPGDAGSETMPPRAPDLGQRHNGHLSGPHGGVVLAVGIRLIGWAQWDSHWRFGAVPGLVSDADKGRSAPQRPSARNRRSLVCGLWDQIAVAQL
ncbi:hypothetical protein JANAI61_14460 [Jannaschia sp. AI_61]|nr:hypothetical protein JANAI61_14460 [Jannaschia sp. AI_61]